MSDETQTETSQGGDKLFTQADMDRVVADRLTRERNTRGDATAEKRELENDLANLRREQTALKNSHKADLAKATTDFAAKEAELTGASKAYRAEVELTAALAKAGIKTELQPGALALLKSQGVEVVDGDGGSKLTINKKPLEDAIASLGDVYLAAAPGGGSGATGNTGDSVVTGTLAWAQGVMTDQDAYRKMPAEDRAKVKAALRKTE